MPASIYAHGQSTLPDGKVLVSGGGKGYIYEPNPNIWSTVASLPANFNVHRQSASSNGNAFVVGGQAPFRNTSYIYTPDNDRWSEMSPIPTIISSQGQSTLNDGRVLISGGWNGTNRYNTAYIYTPNAGIGTWDTMAPLNIAIYAHAQSTLLDGRALVSGGSVITVGVVNTSYIYTPNAGMGMWASASPMPTSIYWHGQSTLADGRILVTGGGSIGVTHLNTAYIYTSNGTWTSGVTLPVNTRVHGQSTLADGRVLISGGENNGNTAYIYTPMGWVHIRVFLRAPDCAREDGMMCCLLH